MVIPVEEATAPDFIQVRAALVKRLGANPAIVWTLVGFRSAEGSPYGYERDGKVWWRANLTDVSRASGLSVDQVRRSLARLEEQGHVEVVEHALDGNWDHTKSYRTLMRRNRHIDAAESTDVDVAKSPNPPIRPLEEGESTTCSPEAGGIATSEELFEAAWKHWPKAEKKKPAREKFLRLVRAKTITAEELAAAIADHGDAYRLTTAKHFVPGLIYWLNQERWDEPLPVARAGRGEERLAESVALVRRLREEENGHAGIGSGAAAALGAER